MTRFYRTFQQSYSIMLPLISTQKCIRSTSGQLPVLNSSGQPVIDLFHLYNLLPFKQTINLVLDWTKLTLRVLKKNVTVKLAQSVPKVPSHLCRYLYMKFIYINAYININISYIHIYLIYSIASWSTEVLCTQLFSS